MVSRAAARAGAPPAAQVRTPLWWPLATLTAVAAAGAFTALHTPAAQWRIAAGGGAAVAVLTFSWALLLARLLRLQRKAFAARLRTGEVRAAEVTHLATVRLPAIVERKRAGRSVADVPGPLSPAADTGEEFARELAEVIAALGSDEGARRERALRDSVEAAFESVARHMHAMATMQQQVLDDVEQSIEDPQLMAGVMQADHAAAQLTRKAQTLLVMCGSWPARRETRPVSLYDCVRGAQSRIVEFGRVEIHGGQTLYVVPSAVEGLMHTVAELLENATVFSPSRTRVVVTVREVGAGAVIEIDDAGLGMAPDVLELATARLRDGLDLTNLGAVPRLGLACAGRWMRELGFGVELSTASAYGGTRAVAFLPYRLLTEPYAHFASAGEAVLPQARSNGYGVETSAGVTAGAGVGGVGAGVVGVEVSGGVGAGARYEQWEYGERTYEERTYGERAHGAHAQVPDAYASEAYGTRPEQGVPHPAGGPPAAPREALPRRRSRRGAAVEAAAQQALQPPPAPEPPARAAGWTPEAARASVANVVTGSRRGRESVADGQARSRTPAHTQAGTPAQIRARAQAAQADAEVQVPAQARGRTARAQAPAWAQHRERVPGSAPGPLTEAHPNDPEAFRGGRP
ncbi:ATP-binding protein [Streptomyces sp. NPDC020412]|uniref:ATP-binding protein n=1 Tax=Streptomyces sp. NPDC020412 TaxID=3365073 RepID=UPI0037A980C4